MKLRNNEGWKKIMLISIELYVFNFLFFFGRLILISFGGFFCEFESFLRVVVGVFEWGFFGILFWVVYCFWIVVLMLGVRFFWLIFFLLCFFNGEMWFVKLVSIYIVCKYFLILRFISILLYKFYVMNYVFI